MPAFWVTSIDQVGTDGTITFNDGRTLDLSTISGARWNSNRLRALNAAVATMFSFRVRQTDLNTDDPDRTRDDTQLRTEYQDRASLESEGGNDFIVYRSVIFVFSSPDTARLSVRVGKPGAA